MSRGCATSGFASGSTSSKRAGKKLKLLDDNMLMIAQALAYASFFAIPSVLLLAVSNDLSSGVIDRLRTLLRRPPSSDHRLTSV